MTDAPYTFFESEFLKSTESVSRITDRIFVGSAEGAANFDVIESLEISKIIVCHPTLPFCHEGKGVDYLRLPVMDLPTESLFQYFEAFEEFIGSGSSQILVHCSKGVSRSSSLVIAHLLISKKFSSFKSAFELVESKRKIIYPNIGFQAQLLQLQDLLADKHDWRDPPRIKSGYLYDIINTGIEEAAALTEKATEDPLAVYEPLFLLECKRLGMFFENLNKYKTDPKSRSVAKAALRCQKGLQNLTQIFPKSIRGVELCLAIAKEIREWLLSLDGIEERRRRSRSPRREKN
jgi:protein-tyrosine phosphatase